MDIGGRALETLVERPGRRIQQTDRQVREAAVVVVYRQRHISSVTSDANVFDLGTIGQRVEGSIGEIMCYQYKRAGAHHIGSALATYAILSGLLEASRVAASSIERFQLPSREALDLHPRGPSDWSNQ
jgi:hypothetical protein